MALLFLVFAVVFGILFLLINFVQVLRGKPEPGFLATLLAFLTTAVILAALIQNSLLVVPDGMISAAVLLVAGVAVVVSLVVLLLELRLPERSLRRSRGVLGVGVGLLIAVSTVTVPFSSAYFSVGTQTVAGQVATPAADSVVNEDTGRAAFQAQFGRFFRNFVNIITTTSGQSEEAIFERLSAGGTLAEVVEEGGGDIEQVIREVVALSRGEIQSLIEQGQIPRLQGALVLTGLEPGIRTVIDSQFTDEQLANLMVYLETPEAEVAAVVSPTATRTPAPTRTSLPTRTPRPTFTPSPTRQLFSTLTPTFTPTLPTPCVITVDYNLNMRAEPSLESEQLLVIPFDTNVLAYGRNADSTWWFVEYENQSGWVAGEFVRASDACTALPVRD